MRLPGDIVYLQGTIAEIREGIALIALVVDENRMSECAGCGKCSGAQKPSVKPIRAPLRGELRVGDLVTVRRFVPNPAVAAGLLFGLPLILAASALVAYIRLFHAHIESPGSFAVVTGSLVVGVICSGLTERLVLPRQTTTIVDSGTRVCPSS